MRRSIYLLLALVLTLAVILPVTADHRMLDQQRGKSSPALQGEDSAWIVWETDNPVQRLAVDGGDIWVGTYGGGLKRWDREIGHQESFSAGAGLPGSDVTGIARDGSGNLWVTLLDGSVVRSSDGSSFSNITPPAPADQNAWTVAARGSDIWVGTLGGGVAHRAGGWTLHAQSDGLPFNDIYAVGLEGDGTPWVGTMGYGIAAYQGGAWVAYDPPLEIANPLSQAENVPNHAIIDIVVDGAGVKWFATDGSGVAALDAGNTSWTVYSEANSGLCGDFVQSVYLDQANNLWFGTLGDGVCRLSVDRTSWSTYDSSSTPLPEDDILDIALDNHGGLWLAAYDAGLAYFGALPDPAPSFGIDPRGMPTLDGSGGHGYWLWLDPVTFEWTLAWTGGVGSHEFEGSLQSPGGFNLVETQGLEAGDQVGISGESLVIEASEGDDWDQVTFALELGVEELTIALRIDGAFYPYRIHVGTTGDLPGTAPFLIDAPQPQPPVVEAGDDLTINEGSYAFLSGSYQDPDSPGGHTVLWDFGDDSSIEDSPSVSHVYVDDGVYTATFTVTDVHGLVAEDTLTVTVENVAPEIDFFYEPFSPSVGQTVDFEAILFDAGVEDTHTLSWDFDEGTPTQEGLITDHVFNTAGAYDVTLTATDDDGGIGTVSYPVTVLPNEAPILAVPEPIELYEGDALDEEVIFTDPDSSGWNVEVNYGDGTVETIQDLTTGAPINLAHTYADNGLYTVTVTITDGQGAPAEGSFDVTVLNIAPTLTASVFNPVEEGAGELFEFGAFTDPGFDCPDCESATLEDFTATVDWGDVAVTEEAVVVETAGSPGVLTTGSVNASHIYAQDGEYTASLTLCDDDAGCVDTLFSISVSNLPPSVEMDTTPIGPINEGTTVSLPTATFSDPGSLDTHRLAIDWGDGQVDETPNIPQGEIAGSHVYGDHGEFVIAVQVCDDADTCDSAQVTATVLNVAPTVDAGPDQTIEEGGSVAVDATFTDPGVADTHTATIDWGDGNQSTGLVDEDTKTVSASHAYVDDGVYLITIKVYDDEGAFGTGQVTATVQNVAPTVDAGLDQTINEGESAAVEATFTDPGIADTHTATIDWGVGGDPEAVAAGAGSVTGSHLYKDDGNHTITVCVQDDDGGDACDFFTLTVDNLPPAVQPGADIDVDKGEPFTADLATFADPGVDDTHTATIDWGDETVEPGQVDQAAGVVSGSHSYLDPGSYTVTIEVCDDGACISVTLSAKVRAKLTPKAGIEAIKAAIEVYIVQDEIDPKAKNSMFSKLDAALKSLEKGKDHTAVNQLGAFINYVEAQSGKKISELAAEDLIARAEAVISLIEAGAATLPRGLFDLA